MKRTSLLTAMLFLFSLSCFAALNPIPSTIRYTIHDAGLSSEYGHELTTQVPKHVPEIWNRITESKVMRDIFIEGRLVMKSEEYLSRFNKMKETIAKEIAKTKHFQKQYSEIAKITNYRQELSAYPDNYYGDMVTLFIRTGHSSVSSSMPLQMTQPKDFKKGSYQAFDALLASTLKHIRTRELELVELEEQQSFTNQFGPEVSDQTRGMIEKPDSHNFGSSSAAGAVGR